MPKTMKEAAQGTRLELLEAMRDRLAESLDSEKCAHRDLASLSLRLIDVTDKIAEIKAATDSSIATATGTSDSKSFLAAV
jgi:hypothetical protein